MNGGLIYNVCKGMSNAAFVDFIKEAYRDTVGKEFQVNDGQFSKLQEIVGFFTDVIEWSRDGEVAPLKFDLPITSGDVIVTFDYFTIAGNDMKRFAEIISYCSSFDVMSVNNKIVMTLTVPGVFETK